MLKVMYLPPEIELDFFSAIQADLPHAVAIGVWACCLLLLAFSSDVSVTMQL